MKKFFEDTSCKQFMFYGDLEDIYITCDLQKYEVYSYLMKMLKHDGFNRVVFFSGAGNHGKFVLDEESARLSITQGSAPTAAPAATQATQRTLRNRRNVVGDAPAPSAEEGMEVHEVKFSQPHISEGTFKDEVLTWSNDPTKKTAVIFVNMWDFLKYTSPDVRRAFGELMMNGWERGDNKQNIYIFLYNNEIEDISSFKALASDAGVDSLFVKGCDGAFFKLDRVLRVGLPGKDELENLLNYLRVIGEDGVSIEFDYNDVPRMVKSLLHYSRMTDKNNGEYEDIRRIKRRILKYAKGKPQPVHIDENAIADMYDTSAEVRNPLELLCSREGWKKPADRLSKFVKEAKLDADEAKANAEPTVEEENDNPFVLLRFGGKEAKYFSSKIPHFALLGNPGVGKSEIARLIGKILHECGILSVGHTVEVTKNDIVSQYVGGTPNKTMSKILEAQGGVLFIDEAHLLFEDERDGGVNYCREAISTLVGAMTNPALNFCLVLSGYPDGVRKMIESDPGLSSRITKDNIIEIDSYDEKLLSKIFTRHVENKGFAISQSVRDGIENFIATKKRKEDKRTFGNARSAIGWAEEVMRNAKLNHRGDRTIVEGDFNEADRELLVKTRKESKEEVFNEIDKYVGFDFMKDIINDAEFRMLEEDGRGQKRSRPRHMILIGNPGTGKTTGAKLLAEFYSIMDVIGSNEVVMLNASDLNDGNYKERLEKAIEDATSRDAILFIDEAHNLSKTNCGQLAIRSLMNPMTENENLTVAFAVYSSELEEFLKIDQGLDGRTDKYHFPDYNGEQLLEIFTKKLNDTGYTYTDECYSRMKILWDHLYRTRRPGFGNARDVNSLIEEMHVSRRRRCVAQHIYDGEEMYRITEEDIPQRYTDVIDAASGANSIDDIMAELSGYIGWTALKEKIKSIAGRMKLHTMYGEEKPRCKHYFFTGPPGAGKTTAAAILARALFAMGLIAENSFIKISAKDLVAGYVGQTYGKTAEMLERGRHGLIFIDEAYTLATRNGASGVDSFNKQAVDEIVNILDDNDFCSDTCVVFAGYKNDMEALLEVNDGLKSRTEEIKFEAYTPEQAYEIFKGFCEKAHRDIGAGVKERCIEIFTVLAGSRRFANGRTARSLFEMAADRRADRVLASECDLNSIAYSSILEEDLPSLEEAGELV